MLVPLYECLLWDLSEHRESKHCYMHCRFHVWERIINFPIGFNGNCWLVMRTEIIDSLYEFLPNKWSKEHIVFIKWELHTCQITMHGHVRTANLSRVKQQFVEKQIKLGRKHKKWQALHLWWKWVRKYKGERKTHNLSWIKLSLREGKKSGENRLP